MYKICYYLYDVKLSDFFDSLRIGYNLHRDELTVKCTKSPKLNSYLHFFCNRIPFVGNSLPETVAHSDGGLGVEPPPPTFETKSLFLK